MRRLYFLLAFAFLLTACHNDANTTPYGDDLPKMSSVRAAGEPVTSGEADDESLPLPESGKFLIKTANIKLQVKDVKQAAGQVKSILGDFDAYVQNEELNTYEYGNSYNLTIRVPAARFDSLTGKLETMGKLIYKSISSEDVTAQVVDLEARLENKKQAEQQYRELLKKCKTVSEILDVNEHLRQVREEIEATEARLKYYKTQAAYSTVYLTLVEPEKQSFPGFNFLQSLWDALLVSWQIFLYLLIVAIASLPFWILGYLIYRVVRYFKRKKKQG